MDIGATEPRLLGSSGHNRLPRLRAHLLDAWRHVPFYRSLYAQQGLTENDLRNLRSLSELPTIGKDQLRRAPINQRLNSRFNPQSLRIESTSGSTGQALSLYLENAYVFRRNLRFLRGLWAVGYRPWHSMLLLTDRFPENVYRKRNWTYCSVEQETAGIAEVFVGSQARVLYGFTTALRLLAETLGKSGKPFTRPRIVISTAEMLDTGTERVLGDVFECPIADFYGLTETGLLAWRVPGNTRYVSAENSIIAELMRDETGSNLDRLIVTNLELRASPVIRYDTGDLVGVERIGTGYAMTRIDGRQIDAIRRRDGKSLSPYVITDAVRKVPGIRRFRVLQYDFDRFTIEIELGNISPSHAKEKISAIFSDKLGHGATLSFDIRDALVTDPARKFRPVECRMVNP